MLAAGLSFPFVINGCVCHLLGQPTERRGEREAEIEGRGTIIRSATIWVAEPSSFERSQFGNESLLAFSRWPTLYRPVSTKLFFGRPSSGKRRRLRRKVRIMFDLHLEFGRIGLEKLLPQIFLLLSAEQPWPVRDPDHNLDAGVLEMDQIEPLREAQLAVLVDGVKFNHSSGGRDPEVNLQIGEVRAKLDRMQRHQVVAFVFDFAVVAPRQ